MKEGEGISQSTYIKDQWTWTMLRGLILEVVGGLDGGGQREKRDNCNSINNKIFLKSITAYILMR